MKNLEKHIDEIIEDVKIGQKEFNYSYYEGINLEEVVDAMIEVKLGIGSEELFAQIEEGTKALVEKMNREDI